MRSSDCFIQLMKMIPIYLLHEHFYIFFSVFHVAIPLWTKQPSEKCRNGRRNNKPKYLGIRYKKEKKYALKLFTSIPFTLPLCNFLFLLLQCLGTSPCLAFCALTSQYFFCRSHQLNPSVKTNDSIMKLCCILMLIF